MDEHTVSGVGPDRIDIAYERRGDPADPVVLLVMRLAAQSVNRPDGFCGSWSAGCRSSASTIAIAVARRTWSTRRRTI